MNKDHQINRYEQINSLNLVKHKIKNNLNANSDFTFKTNKLHKKWKFNFYILHMQPPIYVFIIKSKLKKEGCSNFIKNPFNHIFIFAESFDILMIILQL